MKNDTASFDLQKLSEQIYSYFPDCRIVEGSSDFETEDGSEILTGPQQILPYLQTILFEEHLVEIQLDFTTRLFFANLLDEQPEIVEQDIESEHIVQELEYEEGSYLKYFKDIVLTPLTPGMGNVKIQSCKQVIVRFFSGTSAIELGTAYLKRDTLGGNPVIRLAYPRIGRINRSYRPFRVKAVSTLQAQICIHSDEASANEKLYYQVVDISAMGLAFTIRDEKKFKAIGESIRMEIKVPDINNLTLGGDIRHISRVRISKGYQTIVGVQFDLETRSIAADIEALVAMIQRLQLREMVDRTSSLSGVELIK